MRHGEKITVGFMDKASIGQRVRHPELDRDTILGDISDKAEPIMTNRSMTCPKSVEHLSNLVASPQLDLMSFDGENTILCEGCKNLAQILCVHARKIPSNQFLEFGAAT